MTDKEMDMMIEEITMNVPKDESKAIRSVEAAAMWDVLASQIEQIKAEGFEVDMPFDVPTVDVVDQTLIV
jgi:hypothetical protein